LPAICGRNGGIATQKETKRRELQDVFDKRRIKEESKKKFLIIELI